jgi:hypothetical protein
MATADDPLPDAIVPIAIPFGLTALTAAVFPMAIPLFSADELLPTATDVAPATVFFPMATPEAPELLAPKPTATASSAVAPVFTPTATPLRAAEEAAPLPMAIPELFASEPRPTDTELTPATAPSPTEMAALAFAMDDGPIATLLVPVAAAVSPRATASTSAADARPMQMLRSLESPRAIPSPMTIESAHKRPIEELVPMSRHCVEVAPIDEFAPTRMFASVAFGPPTVEFVPIQIARVLPEPTTALYPRTMLYEANATAKEPIAIARSPDVDVQYPIAIASVLLAVVLLPTAKERREVLMAKCPNAELSWAEALAPVPMAIASLPVEVFALPPMEMELTPTSALGVWS